MDQQNQSGAPKRVPTPQEIARLEAEAAAAYQAGEHPASAGKDAPGEGFVPYVDDVPEAPKPAETEPEGDDPDEEYVPGPWEKRVNALSPEKWKLVQIVGGAVLGLVAVGLLFIGGEELSTYRMILAALVALFVPRYAERTLRRSMPIARRAMIIALLLGVLVAGIIIYSRTGFSFKKADA